MLPVVGIEVVRVSLLYYYTKLFLIFYFVCATILKAKYKYNLEVPK